MNLPTVKNSKNEGRILLGLFAIIFSLEMAIRLTEDQLSGNIQHIFSIPAIASQIDQSNSISSVLFIGNSLTNNAIDTDSINVSLQNSFNKPTATLKVTPDGTALSDWYCIYRNSIQKLGHAPSYIIIGFAWAQLSDQYPINPTRLGGFFCTTSEIGELSATGLTDHRQLLRFFAGSISHIYANREAIRNRILDNIIPFYQDATQRLNSTESTQQGDQISHSSQYSYELLTDTIHLIKHSGSNVILMAMPVINTYELDDNLKIVAQRLDVPLLDMRTTDGIDSTYFKDPIHLNESGQSIFSHQIAETMISYLKEQARVSSHL